MMMMMMGVNIDLVSESLVAWSISLVHEYLLGAKVSCRNIMTWEGGASKTVWFCRLPSWDSSLAVIRSIADIGRFCRVSDQTKPK